MNKLTTCSICGKQILKDGYEIKRNKHNVCSKKCSTSLKMTGQYLNCEHCNKEFYKQKRAIEKTKHHFCSKSCAAKYNNTHKKYGTRRSKLEIYLENTLTSIYSDIGFLFNNKEIINSELDIYIPSLRLAIELNGIFHYEPIFGDDKLSKIQNNDSRKFQACLEHNIELCIIDTSHMKHFSIKQGRKYLKIITTIINKKQSGAEEN